MLSCRKLRLSGLTTVRGNNARLDLRSAGITLKKPVKTLSSAQLFNGMKRREAKSFIHSSPSSPQAASVFAPGTAAAVESACGVAHSVNSLKAVAGGWSSSKAVETPTRTQLKGLFVSSAIPMIGFGFMDNFVMITAGGYIDSTIGVKFGLATMTAAAIGQIFSDVSGVVFGGAMERALVRLNIVKPTNLSAAQRNLPLCRNISMVGAVLGVVTGCLIGASSLIAYDLTASDSLEEDNVRKLNKVLESMVTLRASGGQQERLLNSGHHCVYLVDKKKNELWAEIGGNYNSDPQTVRMPIDGSVAGRCAVTDCVVNEIVEFSEIQRSESGVVTSILCAPLHSSDGEVVGVVEFSTNKGPDTGIESVDNKTGKSGFTDTDEGVARMLAHNLGLFFEHMKNAD